MTYDDLVGSEFLFYGVDNHLMRLDDRVYEVCEDESDGYRSMLGDLVLRAKTQGIFFREPVAIVTFCRYEEDSCDGYALLDEEHDHKWLCFGTDNSDYYYPNFYFNYLPLPAYTPSKRLKPKTPTIHEHDINSFDRLFEQRDI